METYIIPGLKSLAVSAAIRSHRRNVNAQGEGRTQSLPLVSQSVQCGKIAQKSVLFNSRYSRFATHIKQLCEGVSNSAQLDP